MLVLLLPDDSELTINPEEKVFVRLRTRGMWYVHTISSNTVAKSSGPEGVKVEPVDLPRSPQRVPFPVVLLRVIGSGSQKSWWWERTSDRMESGRTLLLSHWRLSRRPFGWPRRRT